MSQGEEGYITAKEFELAISAHFPVPTQPGAPLTVAPFKDSQFPEITRLLEISGKREWSLRPRTYSVLRIIKRLDAMNSFVAEGLYDISLPYSEKTLPSALKSPAARSKFLELQSLVLSTQAIEVESVGGRHRHFSEDGDVHFRHIKTLGEGGFGTVDHVWGRLALNEFARKRMLRGKTFKRDKAAIAAFEGELAILKRLSHRHLVKLVGSYTDPKYVGLIMSPVADCNLAQFLETDPFPTAQLPCLRRFYGCLGSALLYLHANKIRHKDIKPGNILVHGENVLLADFGTSLDWTDSGQSTTISRPNAISVPYCAPEVAAWEPRNSLSDIFSLGCVFLEMATILRGGSLGRMKVFFESHGTKGRYVRTNQEAMDMWLEELRGRPNPGHDNEPLGWVKSMARMRPEDRPSASQLSEQIRACEGGFCGSCCTDDDDDESMGSSYQGSIHTEETVLDMKGKTSGVGAFEAAMRGRPAEASSTAINVEKGQADWVESKSDGSVGSSYQKSTYIPTRGANAQIASAVSGKATGADLVSVGDVATKLEGLTLGGGSSWTVGSLSMKEMLMLRGKTSPSKARDHASRGEVASELLLKNGFDLKASGLDKVTALHWAVARGHSDPVQLLLDHGADIEAKCSRGMTPLSSAAYEGHGKVVQLLIDQGANLEAKGAGGETTLLLAASRGHEAVLLLLIELGAKLEARDSGGYTALLQAASEGHESAVQLLARRGADLEARNSKGCTALCKAASKGHESVVWLLAERGANLEARDSKWCTALLKAACGGHEAVVRLLAEREANLEAKNSKGYTALLQAATKGHEAVVRLLVEFGSNLEAIDDKGYTALLKAATKGHKAVVQLLAMRRADLSARNSKGCTAMIKAASRGHMAVVRLLAERGAQLEAKNLKGYTSLLLAATKGHEEVVEFLVGKGANLEARDAWECTSLFLAAGKGHESIVRFLIEEGANLEAKDDLGYTALHQAASKGREAVVQLLVEQGADVHAKDKSRRKAHDIASDGAIRAFLLEQSRASNTASRTGLSRAWLLRSLSRSPRSGVR